MFDFKLGRDNGFMNNGGQPSLGNLGINQNYQPYTQNRQPYAQNRQPYSQPVRPVIRPYARPAGPMSREAYMNASPRSSFLRELMRKRRMQRGNPFMQRNRFF